MMAPSIYRFLEHNNFSTYATDPGLLIQMYTFQDFPSRSSLIFRWLSIESKETLFAKDWVAVGMRCFKVGSYCELCFLEGQEKYNREATMRLEIRHHKIGKNQKSYKWQVRPFTTIYCNTKQTQFRASRNRPLGIWNLLYECIVLDFLKSQTGKVLLSCLLSRLV